MKHLSNNLSLLEKFLTAQWFIFWQLTEWHSIHFLKDSINTKFNQVIHSINQ